MRLRDMLHHLTVANGLVQLDQEAIRGSNHVRVTGQNPTRKGLEYLLRVPPFERRAAALLKDTVMQAEVVDPAFVSQFQGQLVSLMEDVRALSHSIKAILPKESDHSISVRIPKPDDLDELTATINELKIIFEQPGQRLFGAGNVRVAFQGFDVGTDWIELLLLATPANGYLLFRFVVAFLNASNAYRVKRAEAVAVEASAKEAGVKADVVANLAEAQKEVVNANRDLLSRRLVEAYANEEAPEDAINEAQNSIGIALERWNALQDKGATARPALSAPKEIRANFHELDEPLKLEDFEKALPLLAQPDEPEGGEDGDDAGAEGESDS